jgi:hypothetical protein
MFQAKIFHEDFLINTQKISPNIINIVNHFDEYHHYKDFIRALRERFDNKPECFIIQLILVEYNLPITLPFFIRIRSKDLYIVGLFNNHYQYQELSEDMQRYSPNMNTPCNWEYLINSCRTMYNYTQSIDPFNKEAAKIIALYISEAARFSIIFKLCQLEKKIYERNHGFLNLKNNNDFNNKYNNYLNFPENVRFENTWGALSELLKNWAALSEQLFQKNRLVLPLPVNSNKLLQHFPFLNVRNPLEIMINSDESSSSGNSGDEI